ncbi:MAG: hypothetical protein ACNS61_10720 [Candidatus Wenzhouxiangella sp. M2_3B_020]
MTREKLDNLARIGQLQPQPFSQREFDGLLSSGIARLRDAERPELSLESRFDLAYNAAHALSLAALRWHEFRSENRYVVFQCLQHTVELDSSKWRVLDQAHRTRNLAEYEGRLEIDNALVDAVIRVASDLRARVENLEQSCGEAP